MQQQLQYNKAVLERFVLLKQKSRLAHAYLFVGPAGIGKTQTAVAVAKLLSCESGLGQGFCDACPSCVKINSGSHPDVFLIEKEESGSIKIHQVRELLGRDKLRAFFGGKKVFILKDIETMTLDSANAFLKTLEEPASDTLLILLTSAPENILDTIRSRCHTVYFPSLSDRELAERLENEGITRGHARLYTYFAQGSMEAAARLQEIEFVDGKNGLIDEFILERPTEDRIKELVKDKAATKDFLSVLLSWMRDAMLAKAGVRADRLVHADRLDDLGRFQKRFTFQELKALDRDVVKMCQQLADNLNIKLPLLIIGEQLWER